jgi:hypothetical protein
VWCLCVTAQKNYWDGCRQMAPLHCAAYSLRRQKVPFWASSRHAGAVRLCGFQSVQFLCSGCKGNFSFSRWLQLQIIRHTTLCDENRFKATTVFYLCSFRRSPTGHSSHKCTCRHFSEDFSGSLRQNGRVNRK